MKLRAVRLTHVASGVDFTVGPNTSAADRELAEGLHGHLSGSDRPGRHLVECREHDASLELVDRRDPVTHRVHGIYVYLRKLHVGTPKESWSVSHIDGTDTHTAPTGKGHQHQREQDAWVDAAHTAGYRAEQEVRLDTGVRCDLVIYGPVVDVDIEVQRSHITTTTAQARTRKTLKAGLTPIWSTDRQTDWTRTNAVPHIRTNELPEGHTARDHWLVVGGLREVAAARCTPLNFPACPVRKFGGHCGQFHPQLLPPQAGNPRVYEVAELAPAGGLVVLNAGAKLGRVLVTPEHRDLWDELADPARRPLRYRHHRPDGLPYHRPQLPHDIAQTLDRRSPAPVAPTPRSKPPTAAPEADYRGDPHRYSRAGVPWCHFTARSLYCDNDPCFNPNCRRRRGVRT